MLSLRNAFRTISTVTQYKFQDISGIKISHICPRKYNINIDVNVDDNTKLDQKENFKPKTMLELNHCNQKIQYLSNIYVDRLTNDELLSLFKSMYSKKIADDIVLAGGIGNPYDKNWRKFMEFLSAIYNKVFFVEENNKYWMDRFNDYTSLYNNVHFLNRQKIKLNSDTYIAGCSLSPESLNSHSQMNIHYNFNNNDNNDNIKWILKTVEENTKKNMKTIIVTQYVPHVLTSRLMQHEYSIRNILSPMELELNELINNSQLYKLTHWIYGNLHTIIEIEIKGIKFLVNSLDKEKSEIFTKKNIKIL